MKKLLLISTSVVSMALTSFAVSIDTSETAAWAGYMHVFDNAGGAAGGHLWGSGWGTEALNASYAGGVVTLAPNTNTYADNVANGGASDIAYWTNSVDGGVTAGNDGNKFMQANYYLENPGDNLGWAGQTLTFSGTVDSATLDSRYGAVAFIKVLDVDAGYAEIAFETASITSTGAFSLSHDVAAGNYIGQIGFQMTGINANPDTDWGNVQISGLSATAVPEPSTYALLAGLAAFLFVAIRRRK